MTRGAWALFFAASLAACGGAEEAPDGPFELVVEVVGAGVVESAGGVCEGRCVDALPPGAALTLSAEAAPGHRFLGWSGHCRGEGECEVVMGGERSVTAEFVQTCPPGGRAFALGGEGDVLNALAAVDTEGDIVVAGSFTGALEVGVERRDAGGEAAAFVLSYDGRDCGVEWIQTFGGGGAVTLSALDLDTSGNIYVTGGFEGRLDLGGPMESRGAVDLFMAKISGANGAPIWAVQAEGEAGAQPGRVAVDTASNRVFWAGGFDAQLEIEGERLESGGGADLFVASFDATSGAPLWVRSEGGPGQEVLGGLSLVAGDPVVVGTFEESFGELSCAGRSDAFAMRLDGGSGRVSWRVGLGASDAATASGVAVDEQGGVYLVGRLEGTAAQGALDGAGEAAIFLARHEGAGGALDWARLVVEGAEVGGAALVAFDQAGGRAFVAGTLGADSRLEGAERDLFGPAEVFLAEFEGAGGAPTRSVLFGNEGAAQVTGLTLDRRGAALVLGAFAGSADFVEQGSGEAIGVDGFIMEGL